MTAVFLTREPKHAAASERDRLADGLTGLGNLGWMDQEVRRLAAERQDDPAPFTVALANIDGFRPINDLLGQRAGDDILRQVANRLKACLPDGATVVRVGGDQFGFVLPLVFEQKGAEKVGLMLKDVLAAPFEIGERHIRLSASFGFAIYPFAGDDFDALMKSASTALYRAKRRGRAQITIYSEQIALEMRRRTQIEQALRNAIIADEVDVHFQPIVDLTGDRLVGFEALARWHDADLGTISPSDFVPLAEDHGFIDRLTEVLFRKALRAALAWPKDIFLSFNLSSAQFVDLSIASTVVNICRQTGFDPRRLIIEITETAVMADADTAQEIVAEMRAAGIHVALDDFGTGQSSLCRLRDFAFDKVKIDRSFVSRIANDHASEQIVKAIIAMCVGLNLEVVAEGIETPAEAMKLKALGCHMGQGYFYGRPKDIASTLKDLNGPFARGDTKA
ncbi:diguanylate cyclase [Rhizobium rhizosphaerae]|uniref:Diguanylate cyclase n=1 Tax=Xaviernesmea rhizosphaerae TaxID=1672749 RepID=A0A1Q9AH21_9HYPH|nr:EAL domain-containing protein [Xaviernesmea rhizosphaerae]OLP54531.1 diguanylate cyclase [Xaviernesmea rhizosphaerae]